MCDVKTEAALVVTKVTKQPCLLLRSEEGFRKNGYFVYCLIGCSYIVTFIHV